MKNRKWALMLLCFAMAAAFACGGPGAAVSSALAEGADGSRLIGILITKEDLTGFIGGDGCLWAASVETPDGDVEYVFENAVGLRLLCFFLPEGNGEGNRVVSNVDDGFAAVDFQLTENGESVKMTGTVLCVPGQEEEYFFYNPVFLAADGRVCAVPGDFMAVSADMMPCGASMGQTLRDQRTHTENGTETVDVTEVNVEIRAVRAPQKITFLQFSPSHEALKTEEYAPGDVPEQVILSKEADYLLVETEERTADGGVYTRREVFGREDDCLNTLLCREDGICIQIYHEILWQE